MKITKNIFLFTLLAAAFMGAAHAEEFGSLRSAWCEHPVSVTCSDRSRDTVARFDRINEKRRHLSVSALDLVRQRYHLSFYQLPTIQSLSTLAVPLSKKQQIYSSYVAHIQILSSIGNMMDGLGRRVSTQAELVRKLMLRAIDGQFPAFGPWSRVNAQLKNEVNRTIVMDPMLGASFASLPADHVAAIKDAMSSTCGLDGLELNAFALPVENAKYMVICPGWLVASSASEDDLRTNLENLVQVLGHEWGHHIDSNYFPGLYKDFLSCMQDRYAHELLPLQRQKLRPEMLRHFPNFGDDAMPFRKVERHAREMVADIWGAKVMSEYLKEFSASWDQSRRLNAVREAYGAHCALGSEGIHPTTAVRLDLFLGQDAGIRAQLGCPVLPSPRSCGFGGFGR
jgi:hypothetical protein